MKPSLIVKMLLFSGTVALLPQTGMCQKWVADTITIRFGNSERISKCTFNLLQVNDCRKTFPEYISIYEQKKWLFFPVDQIVRTDKPLSAKFIDKFSSEEKIAGNYIASIHQFNIKNTTAMGRRGFTLFSTVELSEIIPKNDTILIGSFYYERSLLQKKKEKK